MQIHFLNYRKYNMVARVVDLVVEKVEEESVVEDWVENLVEEEKVVVAKGVGKSEEETGEVDWEAVAKVEVHLEEVVKEEE